MKYRLNGSIFIPDSKHLLYPIAIPKGFQYREMPRGVVLPLDLPVRPGKTSALLVLLAFAQFGQFLQLSQPQITQQGGQTGFPLKMFPEKNDMSM